MRIAAGSDPVELLAGANPASAAALQNEMTLAHHIEVLERAVAAGNRGRRSQSPDPPAGAQPGSGRSRCGC